MSRFIDLEDLPDIARERQRVLATALFLGRCHDNTVRIIVADPWHPCEGPLARLELARREALS